MRAVVYDRYGGPDVLRVEDVPVAEPGPREVRVRVHAAAVNPYDFHFMRGTPLFMRAMVGLRRPKSRRLGKDVAGEVEAVGPGVTAFKVGDAVFGAGFGSFAESCLADVTKLAPKPEGVSFDDAAAVGMVGVTGLQGLQAAGMKRGDRVLVLGASGGIGHVAVQVAKAHGTTVTAACRPLNAAWVKDLGADRVVSYEVTELQEAGPFDTVLDIVSLLRPRDVLKLVAEGGAYAVVGFAEMGLVLGPMPRVFGLRARSSAARPVKVVDAAYNPDTLATLAALIEKGALKVRIEHAGGLADVPDAITRVEEGRAKGKTVIRPQA